MMSQAAKDLKNGRPAMSRPQPDIGAQAEAELRRSPYSLLKRISCQYNDGVLTLSGCLPSYYLKQIAQTLVAQRLTEAVRIENRVEVKRAV